MERAEALAALREVAVEVLSVEPDAVVEDARFKEDLDADSLDLVELVMGLEERFDIEVPEDDLEDVTTVGQAVDLVLAKVGRQGMTDADFLDAHGRPRVVVTGMGVKTPAGIDLDTFWATVLRRASARAERIERFDPSELPGAVRGARSSTSTRRRTSARRRCAASTASPSSASRAAADALADAGELGADPSRCAVIVGTGVGGLEHARGATRPRSSTRARAGSARSSCR